MNKIKVINQRLIRALIVVAYHMVAPDGARDEGQVKLFLIFLAGEGLC